MSEIQKHVIERDLDKRTIGQVQSHLSSDRYANLDPEAANLTGLDPKIASDMERWQHNRDVFSEDVARTRDNSRGDYTELANRAMTIEHQGEAMLANPEVRHYASDIEQAREDLRPGREEHARQQAHEREEIAREARPDFLSDPGLRSLIGESRDAIQSEPSPSARDERGVTTILDNLAKDTVDVVNHEYDRARQVVDDKGGKAPEKSAPTAWSERMAVNQNTIDAKRQEMARQLGHMPPDHSVERER